MDCIECLAKANLIKEHSALQIFDIVLEDNELNQYFYDLVLKGYFVDYYFQLKTKLFEIFNKTKDFKKFVPLFLEIFKEINKSSASMQKQNNQYTIILRKEENLYDENVLLYLYFFNDGTYYDHYFIDIIVMLNYKFSSSSP